jgi:hypothetical protein
VVTEGFEQGGANWTFAGSFLTPDVSSESPRNGRSPQLPVISPHRTLSQLA